MPHIFYTNTSHSVKTLTFRCVKEMSQGRRFFYAPKRVFYKEVFAHNKSNQMYNVFIDKTVRCAGRSATSLISYNKVGVHRSTDVW